jgi:peptidoglycan/LPS O-acetylase OafA/YrhL
LRRIPQLDGLRGIAIGLVLLHHYIYQMHPSMPDAISAILIPVAGLGWSGVDLFFILSGFLIGGILVDAKESVNYYRTFYIRRAFRILPIYLFLVLLGFFLTALAAHSSGAMSGLSLHPAPWWYYLTFTQNFYFAKHSDVLSYLQITWSLAVEEQFYLTLPLLVRKVDKNKLLAVAIGMVIFFGVLRSVLYWHGSINAMQSYVLPFCRFDSLFIGVACAMLVRNQSLLAKFQKHSRLLAAATIALGAAFLFMDHHLWGKNLFLHTAGFTLIGLFYAAVMMLVLVRPEGALSRALQFRPLMGLGTISYCVYLIHGYTLILTDHFLQMALPISDMEVWFTIIVGAAMTFLLAQGSWVWFESRMIALGHRFTYQASKTSEPAAHPA